ncbi:MAG: hypothetical protein NZT92_19650 [Abditibacteriales bacterium]|nr:hypothetical protein [Abditibacteriales bacterium]MDW8367956.1 hypothetical protein [Abditibacteriales bacterium]
MAIYWHPFLVQFLRQDYGDRLIIEDEVNLGEMPLRVDLLLIKRDPQATLPYPFNHLGERTLVSYCGPEDRANWKDVVKLEVYGRLYQLRENLLVRSKITLWLMASRFARQIFPLGGGHLGRVRRGGPGGGGKFRGFSDLPHQFE